MLKRCANGLDLDTKTAKSRKRISCGLFDRLSKDLMCKIFDYVAPVLIVGAVDGWQVLVKVHRTWRFESYISGIEIPASFYRITPALETFAVLDRFTRLRSFVCDTHVGSFLSRFRVPSSLTDLRLRSASMVLLPGNSL